MSTPERGLLGYGGSEAGWISQSPFIQRGMASDQGMGCLCGIYKSDDEVVTVTR